MEAVAGLARRADERGGPVHERHHHVEDDGVGTGLLRDLQALRAAAGLDDLDPVHGEGEADELARVGIVVRDQDLHRRGVLILS